MIDNFLSKPEPATVYWIAVHVLAVLLAGFLAATAVLWLSNATQPLFGALERAAMDLTATLTLSGAGLAFLWGAYGRPFRWYWLAITGFMLLMITIGFLGYLLPIGQISFWLASKNLPPLPGWSGLFLPVILLALFVFHIRQMHRCDPGDAVHGRYSRTGLVCAATLLVLTSWYFWQKYAWVPDLEAPATPAFQAAGPATLPASPLSVPAHIVPNWKFLPFYAVMRTMPVKAAGVAAMFASIGAWLLLPWLDRGASNIRAFWKRHRMRWVVAAILACILVLFGLGAQPASFENLLTARVITAVYFALFLVGIPWATSARTLSIG